MHVDLTYMIKTDLTFPVIGDYQCVCRLAGLWLVDLSSMQKAVDSSWATHMGSTTHLILKNHTHFFLRGEHKSVVMC